VHAVEETPIDEVRGELTDVVEEAAASIDARGGKLILASGRAIPYHKICLCMGASPKRSRQGSRRVTPCSSVCLVGRVRNAMQYAQSQF
jgi:hypothetical protein